MNNEQLSHVENFVLTHDQYGEVRFHQPVDLTSAENGIVLNNIVVFKEREIDVYPQEENYDQTNLKKKKKAQERKRIPRPDVGHGLNVEAEVELLHVWPKDSTGKFVQGRKAVRQYEKQVEAATKRVGARLVRYEATTGRWIFHVDHF
ncbi:MAG: hypothetical protein EZS28_010895 [Streblomastix strix]|uniref:Peptidase S59 domain-containing protein n=1 Tax=Streblomastix strix TaxID=222440 RepID=A0A5J4WGS6_9EUKA|nr:MAG: hypothetical protein EZS28_010895 [Streblomastix strix]